LRGLETNIYRTFVAVPFKYSDALAGYLSV
jgi:hypothetical protein